ncbi:MAG: DUF2807 domain-containing protein [Bacteroidales bacterium]|jgi:hypothetical protein|nr:DUF2807 domain-containing protein [Bacteroidales bacterium]
MKTSNKLLLGLAAVIVIGITLLIFAGLPHIVARHLAGVIHGNGNLVNSEIDISDFEDIELNISAIVFYRQNSDSSASLRVHTDENIMNALEIKTIEGRLCIDVKGDSAISPSELTIYVNSRSLKGAVVSGSGKIHLNGNVNVPAVSITIRGSGSFLTENLFCEQISASILGSGYVELKGASNSASFAITGSGNLNASDYLVQHATCAITGSGNIRANAVETIDASITGSGNITYFGNPHSVHSSVKGSGNIQHAGA